MSLTMYQASIPPILQILNSLSAILGKTAAHCEARKIDPAVLLNSRLFPDMFPLARQIQIATDHAKGLPARLSGVDVPSYADSEATIADLAARVGKTIAFVGGFTPAQIDGSEDRPVTVKAGPSEHHFVGRQYLVHYALPNFYFHVSMTYAILRHSGVDVGKRDYLGAI